MDNLPLKYHPWSDRLAMDVALALEGSGETLPEIMLRHNIVADDLGRFNSDPVFLQKVGFLREEVRTKGMTFRLKARAQAEELLTTSWTLIHSNDVSAAVKASAEWNSRKLETYGEANEKNCRQSYVLAMAEKRAMSRIT